MNTYISDIIRLAMANYSFLLPQGFTRAKNFAVLVLAYSKSLQAREVAKVLFMLRYGFSKTGDNVHLVTHREPIAKGRTF